MHRILRFIRHFFVGPIGVEKLAFPLLRAQLHNEFMIEEEMEIYGRHGNMIDCVYIPSKQRRLALREQAQQPFATGVSSHVEIDRVSSQGTVVYCNPNAMYFELFGYPIIPLDEVIVSTAQERQQLQRQKEESNWVRFYTELGFDVVCWNYRGYGRSDGGKFVSVRLVKKIGLYYSTNSGSR